jgi:hypothetical protein
MHRLPRLSIVAFATALLACSSSTCKGSSTASTDAAGSDANATSAEASTTDTNDAGARTKLSAFASADDFNAFLKQLVRDEELARENALKKRADLLEAGTADGATVDGMMAGDAIGDAFGGGGLGLSGIGEGGGGMGEGIGLGNIGTIGHGAGTGTGAGYGSGAGRLGRGSTPAPAANGASITNVQVEGVDEGDIVKSVGDYLVVLRRGRLFTVKVGERALTPTSSIDAFGPGLDPSGAWYDEMLVSKNRVVVIGYSYARGGTEIGLFDLDEKGALTYRSTYHLRASDYYSSRNYASRLLGEKLVFYSPTSVSARDREPLARFPALRKWKTGAEPSTFASVLEPTRLYKPLLPATYMTLHAVTVCDLASAELTCTSRGVLGPSGRVFYVSQSAVYVWTTPYSYRPRKRLPDGGLAPIEHTVDPAAARSYVYRLPLDGSEPTVVRASGAPIDQFSFHEGDGHLDVLVRDNGSGDAMWAAEGTTDSIALVRLPLASFGGSADAAPASAYTTLAPVSGYALQNRFVGDYVLYGAGSGWGGARKLAERKVMAYRYASHDPKTLKSLPLDHVIDRIEPMGSAALVVGNRDSDLVFSAIALGAQGPEARGAYVEKGSSQGETRSHGFFYKPESDTTGVFGLPIRGGDEAAANQLRSGSASIVFVKNESLDFKDLGRIAAKGGTENDGCRASCVDWYGNARPIFMGDRVLSLMGYEIVESAVEGGRMVEKRRVSFAPKR